MSFMTRWTDEDGLEDFRDAFAPAEKPKRFNAAVWFVVALVAVVAIGLVAGMVAR